MGEPGTAAVPGPGPVPALEIAGAVPRSPGTGPTRRRPLWSLRPDYHCSILGTCLSLGDLRKIAAKAGLQIHAEANEYEVHGCFVKLAAEPGRTAKAMNKWLDRKYRTTIERGRRLADESDLRRFWEESLAKGDVSGPYWALMTHPSASEGLMVRAFGEVHMLSHLAGASNRADLRRLNALEEERRAFADELAAVREQLSERSAEVQRLVERRAVEAQALKERLRANRAVETRLAEAEARIRAIEGGHAFQDLRARNDALAAKLEEMDRDRRMEARRRRELEHEVSDLRLARDAMGAQVRALGTECEALESRLRADLARASVEGGEPSPSLDLRGRRIAYLGGRPGLIGHFRALVEQSNGELIHHDGGIDDSERRLDRILGQADAVLCPVDCVSHGACLRAKRFCKRTAKPFVPLRSAGLSSLAAGLREVAFEGGPGFVLE